eukprot:1970408-Rhodomonas_salina.1
MAHIDTKNATTRVGASRKFSGAPSFVGAGFHLQSERPLGLLVMSAPARNPSESKRKVSDNDKELKDMV